jgi:hypothetical protein
VFDRHLRAPAEATCAQEGSGCGDHRPGDRHRFSKRDRARRPETDDGEEASPEIKAFFARMMRPHRD